jgi:2-oxo-3-hexenedioate decarboxylase
VTYIDTLAEQLMDCAARAALLPLPSVSCSDFDVPAAYRVLDAISARRRAAGWHPVGHKIGFTNRSIWAHYGVSFPIWAPMWSSTVHFARQGQATLELAAFTQPRIEPEIAFKLSGPVAPTDHSEEVLRSVEWLAPAFEVVQCHYSGWKFSAPDCIADFGLHGALIIGTPVRLAGSDLGRWAAVLASFGAALIRGAEVVDRGGGALVLGSPALALAHLAGELAARGRTPLAAGEIVTTGTLTDAWPVGVGQSWSADFSTVATQPLSVHFR